MKHSLQKILSLIASAVLLLSMLSCGMVSTAVAETDTYTVAQGFEGNEAPVSSSANATYELVDCVSPYGQALKFGRGATAANITLTFDEIGTADQAALVFYYDVSGSAFTADHTFSFVPITKDGNQMCLGTSYTYYTVIDGVVAEAKPSSNFTLKVAKGTKGWIILPLPGSGTWSKGGTGAYYGTTQDLASVYLEFVYYTNASIVVDQFGFTSDVAAFQADILDGVEDLNGYTDVHTWTEATCSAPKTCAKCGTTEGEPTGIHTWVNGVCSACSTSLLTVAQNFDLATDSSYVNGVTSACGSDFGKSVKFSYNADLGSGTASANFQHIAFDSVGTAEDEAMVFYYDNTTSGKNAVLYFAPVNTNGVGTTIKTGHPVTTIINGVLTEDNTSIVNSNFTMTLPANSSGWVMLQIGRNGTSAWALWGGASVNSGVTGISRFAVRTNSTTSVVLDQFGFVKSMDAFAAMAANNANVAGYTGKQHTWADASCTAPKTCTVCGATEGAAADHSWIDATCTAPKTCSICGATEGEPSDVHTWVNGACSACGKALFTMAEDFASSAVTGTEGAWSNVSCVSPYGEALKHNRTGDDCIINIPFDVVGTAAQKAIVFYYDNTMSGYNGEAPFRFRPYTTSGRFATLGGGYVYYTVIDGVVTEKTVTDNMNLRLPAKSAGWVILPLPQTDKTWPGDGSGSWDETINNIAGADFTYVYYAGASIVLDQFGFVADVDAFQAQVLSGADTLPGYEGINHVWGDADCTTPMICEKCGSTSGEALGHSWVAADCDTPKTCSVCGATEGDALGHSWVAADCDTPKTCSVCGATEGDALGHSWVAADCDTPKTCSVCGATEGDALGHSWVNGTCSACGKAVYNTVVNFADKMNTNETIITGVGSASVMRERLVWERGDGSATGTSFATINFAATGDTAEEALIFWADSTKVAAGSGMNLIIYDTNGSRCLRIAENAPYQFVAADGTVSNLTTVNEQSLPLVDNAKGWYVVPFSSFEAHWSTTTMPVAAGKVNSLFLALASTYGDVLALDDICFAVDTEAAVQALSYAASATKLIGYLGTSINEAENALRFGFTLEAAGITVEGYQRDISAATVVINGETYELKNFGAIVSNSKTAALTLNGVDGKRTKNIVGNKLFDLEGDIASFACGIKNIPAANKDSMIYACPYFIYNNGTEDIVVYGDEYEQSINGFLAL